MRDGERGGTGTVIGVKTQLPGGDEELGGGLAVSEREAVSYTDRYDEER